MKFVDELGFEDMLDLVRSRSERREILVNATNLITLAAIEGDEIYDIIEEALDKFYKALDMEELERLFSDGNGAINRLIPKNLGYQNWDELGTDVYNKRHGGKR